MSGITTHVLDLSLGKPAGGVPVILDIRHEGGAWQPIGRGATDADGRCRDLLPASHVLVAGIYKLTFDVAAYQAVATESAPFFPEVSLVFSVVDASQHFHVPLLLSAFGYSTYRGSLPETARNAAKRRKTRPVRRLGFLVAALLVAHPAAADLSLAPGPTGFRDAAVAPVRGLTIGPIENSRHPGRGYGSPAFHRALVEAKRMGATWVSITPFGRVLDLAPTGIDRTFEAPFSENKDNVLASIRMAHDEGLRVLLVPHLWVESGEWRALIDPKTDAGWARWATAYAAFAKTWADVAEAGHADLLSVGVEQRSFVTTSRAPLYEAVLTAVRSAYHGPLTYSANWDDVDDTVILGAVDVIGINAFYPLADKDGASERTLLEGGKRVAERVSKLAARWQKPVLFTEIGYTTRPDPAIRPWEWPDAMKDVKVDERAQAEAYACLLAPLLDEPSFAGFFVWRLYADPDDQSQEAEWGFSPRGKLAELVVRDAFSARWAADALAPGDLVLREGATDPFVYPGPSLVPW